MSDRIKGQEVALSITVDGALQTTIDTIQSAEMEFELDLLEEGYLGETSDRVDSIYKLMRVNLEGHVSNRGYVELADAIVQRAQRRAGAAIRIDVVGTFRFPDDTTMSILIPDVYFEAIPLSVGGRAEFVGFTLAGKARGYQFI